MNSIEYVKNNLWLFVPAQNLPHFLLSAVVRDFLHFGDGDFTCGLSRQRYFLTSKAPWIPKPEQNLNCFEEIVALGQGHPNSHRTEVLIAATCRAFTGIVDGQIVAMKGDILTDDMDLKVNALVWELNENL